MSWWLAAMKGARIYSQQAPVTPWGSPMYREGSTVWHGFSHGQAERFYAWVMLQSSYVGEMNRPLTERLGHRSVEPREVWPIFDASTGHIYR